jgi:hypothetical protein
MSTYEKDSAQLEREIEEQRQRIEHRVGEIKERLSPGQLVDEVLSYTKNGGQQFVGNLGSTISANPLPAALLGVSLIWLISGQGAKASPAAATFREERDYPYATINGSMRRISHGADEAGDWYSEFEDGAGKKFKAKSNELGHRLGAFMDESGRAFGGFIDDAGHRVRDFSDEVGNRFDEASGWASHRFHDVQHGVASAVHHAGQTAHELTDAAQGQVDRASRMIASTFESQPLVAGALAFAAGAALGAALPHTREEDKLLGAAADKARSKASAVASEVYDAGKEAVGDLYERGKDAAGDFVDKVAGSDSPPRRGSEYH